ncbi:hypothetical protein ACUY4R_004079 [Kosakonia sp. BK9b]
MSAEEINGELCRQSILDRNALETSKQADCLALWKAQQKGRVTC